MSRATLLIAAALCVGGAPLSELSAQAAPPVPVERQVKKLPRQRLSGPRFGFTTFTGETADLRDQAGEAQHQLFEQSLRDPHRFQHKVIRQSVLGLRRVMADLKMLPPSRTVERPASVGLVTVPPTRRSMPTSSSAHAASAISLVFSSTTFDPSNRSSYSSRSVS